MVSTSSLTFCTYLAVLALLSGLATAAKERNKNVFGMQLEKCSTEGMAMTGITGTGHCVHFDSLHHDDISKMVCVDVPSFSDAYFGDRNHAPRTDFQPDFFQGPTALDEMPCTEDATKDCPIKNWCINEDSFASYVDNVGGCDKIGRILCQSTNQETIAAYEQRIMEGRKNDPETTKIQAALDCVKFKCWIN